MPPVEHFPLGGQLGILRFPCLYRQGGLADHHKSKGRGASPLSLRLAPVPAPVCAALLRWMGGLVGGYPAPLFLRPGRRGSTSELQRSHEEDDGANTQ